MQDRKENLFPLSGGLPGSEPVVPQAVVSEPVITEPVVGKAMVNEPPVSNHVKFDCISPSPAPTRCRGSSDRISHRVLLVPGGYRHLREYPGAFFPVSPGNRRTQCEIRPFGKSR